MKKKKTSKKKNLRKFLLRSLIDGRHGVEIFSIQSGWQINLQPINSSLLKSLNYIFQSSYVDKQNLVEQFQLMHFDNHHT
jgi:hypothetical protein